MDVYEADLPGVGKKFEAELDEGRRLVIVIHNTGKREVFVRPEPDADAERLFALTDRQARQIGTILEGAYFQPIRTESLETVLGEGTLIDWVNVAENSPLVGQTLEGAQLRRETGASVLAVQRDDETITNPGGDTTLEAGDTLVVLGSREACSALEDFLSPEEADEPVETDEESTGTE